MSNIKKLQIYKMMSKMGFCKLWFKIVWKMRSVYCALAVHTFDVLTDVLVIISWWDYEEIYGDVDNINTRTMALCGIIALSVHKLISMIAFWAKEKSIIRVILQLFDLLIFEEIYLTHERILIQLNNLSQDKKKDDAIETTSTFKYVCNLEAIFESIPQSILQLIFLMRTAWTTEGKGIFLAISLLSTIQSIISMTNSIINNDNTYMTYQNGNHIKNDYHQLYHS